MAGSGDWLLGGWKCPDKGNVTPGLQQSLHCHPLPRFLIASCVLLGQFSFYSSFQGSVCSSMKASPTISACHSYSAKHMASGLKERQLRASKHQLEQKCRGCPTRLQTPRGQGYFLSFPYVPGTRVELICGCVSQIEFVFMSLSVNYTMETERVGRRKVLLNCGRKSEGKCLGRITV